jgi:hypothetical protein
MPNLEESKAIAKRELVLKGPGVEDKLVEMYIGPIGPPDDNGDVACVFKIVGYINHTVQIHGVDDFHALLQAIKFSESLLSDLPAGWTIHWKDGEPL